MKLRYPALFCICLCCGCAGSKQGAATPSDTAEGNEIRIDDHSLQNLMVPEDAVKTVSGYRYVTLTPGKGQKPSHTDAVQIHVHVVDVEGKPVDDQSATVSMAHSTPFLEEILAEMELGQRVRVWGESQTHIWEIELLGIDETFKAPEDVGSVPENAQKLEGIEGMDGVYWRVVEPGHGESPHDGQALRFKASRWKSNGEILESNQTTNGQLVFLNRDNPQIDPIHHAILYKIHEGEHIRIWIPGSLMQTDYDLVEDMWITEYLTQLDTPQELAVPAENVETIEPDAAFMRLLSTQNASKLVDKDVVQVNMTCWNGSTGTLVDSSLLRGQKDIMELTDALGVWLKIMKNAAPGDEFMAWIKASALPESVGMDLTCRVTVFDKITGI